VARQEEFEEIGEDADGAAFRHLTRISQGYVVWKSQFPKSHQCEEAHAELRVEEKVIVGAGVIVGRAYGVEVHDGQGTFSDGRCPTQSFATFQHAMNESSSPGVADVSKIRFKLLTDARKVRVD